MSTFELGQTLSVPLTITSDGTTPADLTTCVATWTKPDGTTAAGTVTHPGTGQYVGQFAASTLAGRWRCTFTGTGTYAGALPWSDVVDVWPADPRLALSLADIKAGLNFPAGVLVNDDELRLYSAAATQVIEDMIGPILAETRTHTYDGGRSSYVLPEVGIAGVTSITVNGAALPSTAYAVDTYSGVIDAYYGSFIWGRKNVVVTYTVGSTAIPPNVILAARELIRFQWQIGQQGAGVRGRVAAEADAWTPSGFAVPRRVIELLQPQMTTAS